MKDSGVMGLACGVGVPCVNPDVAQEKLDFAALNLKEMNPLL
jgi:hypothetical protein